MCKEMSVVSRSVSYLFVLGLLLMGFTAAWEDTLRTDGNNGPYRSWIIKRLTDSVRNLKDAQYKELRRRQWVPDAGYASRGQAGEDVSRRLLAKALAENPYGPGRRR